jgi:DNA polymerase-3 subunit beta
MTFLEMSRDTLLRPLQIVCGIVERRAAPLPILSSVMLSTAGARLQLRSTDLELELTATETLGAHAAET